MSIQTTPKIITIIGATGQQGNAAIQALLKDFSKSDQKYFIRALTRDPDSKKAKDLASHGVEVVKCDINNKIQLIDSLKGTWGLYMVTTMSKGDKETQEGKTIIDAAIIANVSFIVFSSVAAANRNTGIPHFETKYKVEQYLTENSKKLKDGYFILRPVYFMDNLKTFSKPSNGVFTQPLSKDTKLQLVAVDDIGIFISKAFLNPEEYNRIKELDLAGDELSMTEMANILSNVSRTEIQYKEMNWIIKKLLFYFMEDLMIMFNWFETIGYSADIKQCQKLHPNLLSFEKWAKMNLMFEDMGRKSSFKRLLPYAIGLTVIGCLGYYFGSKYKDSLKQIASPIYHTSTSTPNRTLNRKL